MKSQFAFPIAIVLCFIFATNTSAQTFDPTIIIISPNKTAVDKKLSKEIDKTVAMLAQRQSGQGKPDDQKKEDEPDNFRIMSQKQTEFLKQVDFYSIIPMISEGYLQYKFSERFENLLIYAVPEKSDGTINSLSSVAGKNNMQYVVNFPEVNAALDHGSKKMTIKVQLYDHLSKTILLEKEYTGHDGNPGFEFACQNGSVLCTVNNALSKALNDIVRIVAENNPSLIRERQLAGAREVELFTTFYPKKPDQEIVTIIGKNFPNTSVDGFYHGFMDDTRTKFIAFFARNSNTPDLKDLENKEDTQVNIVTMDMKSLKVPSIYAHIVIGINYKSKWYISKQYVTYFQADDLDAGKKEYFDNLQKWDFFKENTTELNPDFWETNLFGKVPDLTKDPDWKRYKDSMWKADEAANRPYIGMYEIVATELKKEASAEAKKFDETYGEQVMRPFLDRFKSDATNDASDYILMDKKFKLIFPQDRSIILCPVSIKDKAGKNHLRYFVSFPGKPEVYEWTYFKPVQPKYDHFGGALVDQLETLTSWNFSITTLEDPNFWNNYVIKMENGNYVHLKKMN